MRSMAVVKLDTVDKVKKFVNIIAKYDNATEVWELGGHKVFSASSIISIFSLDFNKDLGIKINTYDEGVADKFYDEMKIFAK